MGWNVVANLSRHMSLGVSEVRTFADDNGEMPAGSQLVTSVRLSL